MEAWYDRPIDPRAPAGGEIGVDGKTRKGGEFEPFYVPRNEMPQVSETDYPALLEFAARKGVSVSFQVFRPEDLKKHQRVMEGLLKETMETEPVAVLSDKMSEPVLVSKDLFILDGNHRRDAHAIQGTPVLGIVIELEFEEAIKFLFEFPKTSISTIIK